MHRISIHTRTMKETTACRRCERPVRPIALDLFRMIRCISHFRFGRLTLLPNLHLRLSVPLRNVRKNGSACACLIEYFFSDKCFSLEAIEGHGGRTAVFLSKMWPYLLAQVQPDEALAPRVRCRAQISVPKLQEAIQAPSSSAGPPEDSLLCELRLRDTQLKPTPSSSENGIARYPIPPAWLSVY